MAEKKPSIEEFGQIIKKLEKENLHLLLNKKIFFENSFDGIVIINPETAGFIEFNDKACLQLGYTREEFEKLTIFDVEVSESREETKKHIQQVLKLRNSEFETIQRTKNGELRNIAVSARIIKLPDDEIFHCIWRDITELKRNEKDLIAAKVKAEKSELLYKSLFNNINNSSSLYEVIFDENNVPIDYKFLAINPEYEKSIGIKASDLIGKTLLTVFPGTEPVWLEKMKEVVMTGNHITIENYSVEVDRYFELTIFVPQKGQMALIGSDITSRKKNEQEIIQEKLKAENRNAFIQTIIENSNNSIWAIDSEYRLTYFNQVFKNEYKIAFGIDLKNGLNIIEIIPENIKPIWKERYDRVLNNESLYLEDKIEIAPDDFIYISVSMIPIFSNKKVIGASLYGANITERKNAELELLKAKEHAEESEALYRKMNENSPLGMHFYKLDNHKLIFVGANPAADILLNADNSQFIGKSIEEAFPPLAQTEVPKRYCDAAEKGIPWFTEQIIYDDHKITGAFEVRAFQTTPNNMVALFNEITKRKQIEQELIQAKEKAEESDRLKTAFLQNLSHEIRTPLNAICGFSEFLNDPDLADEKRKSFTSIIRNSSSQLLSIVSDILTISSLETKQEKTNISKVCINHVLIELLSIFKPQALNQNISLYIKQQLSDKQSEICTDGTKITQILTNLLTNAIKFTHEGYIEFGYNLVENNLEFYVKDTGIGIKPEFCEKIFERFRQADMSINKKYGGTGLGLSISKGFVELLGGKIWVNSEPDKGSTFFFTVPYYLANQVKVISDPVKMGKPFKTVIVAEDEEYNFLFIEELLINMNLTIIHTKDGKETVDICNENPNIDLILMDIKMPVMDGYEAAKIIKKLKPEIPIIAQSAYALDHERAKFEGIFDDYLTKPISSNNLKQSVLKYLEVQVQK